MQNSNRRNKIEFPIIADDQVLVPDHRVIMTNQELLTNNPSDSSVQRMVNKESISESLSESYLTQNADIAPQDTFETRRHRPTTEGKRPLGKTSRTTPEFDLKRKSTVVEDARKRARENAVQPKPIKAYVSPLQRTTAEELGIKGLANKKVVNTQHSLGKSSTDVNQSKASDMSLQAESQDYFASKHQQHEQVETTE